MKTAQLLGSLTIILTVTAQSEIERERIRYAVIGDSYSCGEGATPKESWPELLTQHLNAEAWPVDLVANPSITGWTTKEAIDRELPIFIESKPNFASLQIGVNDWWQGVDEAIFRKPARLDNSGSMRVAGCGLQIK